MTALSVGEIELPEHWEIVTEATLLAPALAAPMAPGRVAPARPNLIVKRRRTSEPDLETIALATRRQLTEAMPGARWLDSGEVRFDDGQQGHYLRLSFTAPNGVGVLQEHRLRLDGGVVTSLSATATGEQDLARLVAVMAGYRPPAEEVRSG